MRNSNSSILCYYGRLLIINIHVHVVEYPCHFNYTDTFKCSSFMLINIWIVSDHLILVLDYQELLRQKIDGEICKDRMNRISRNKMYNYIDQTITRTSNSGDIYGTNTRLLLYILAFSFRAPVLSKKVMSCSVTHFSPHIYKVSPSGSPNSMKLGLFLIYTYNIQGLIQK